ncbi:MAG: ABC transporter permease subunit [bacterium]
MNGIKFTSRNMLLVWRKELLDIVRDRRTLMSMIVVPLLLMPVMMLGIGALMASSMQDLESRTYSVGLVNPRIAPEVADALRDVEKIQVVPVDSEDELRGLITDGVLSAGVAVREDQASNIPTVVVYSRKSKEASRIAGERLRSRMDDLRNELSSRWLERIGAPLTVLDPIEITSENLASSSEMAKSSLASFLPYMLILMAITGAIYPAIDMTAGEKERSTLETILASPAARSEIVLGKFLAVMTTSIISTLISLTSFFVVLGGGLKYFGAQFGETLTFSISAGTVLQAVALMLPLAALFSSVLIAIAINARSSREAQSYLTPLMFLVIVPAMTSMLPGSEGSAGKAWIPVVNVSLALRDALNGETDPQFFLLAVFSTLIYAALGIALTIRMFQRENVLFKV